jgi:hypothetical protein
MSAAAAQLVKPSPLPAEVDERATKFHQLELDIEKVNLERRALEQELAAKKTALIELVRQHGSTHAKKSKILHGIAWEIMATFSKYTTQDGAAVDRFRQALVKAKKTRLLEKIFQQDVRWVVKASASEIVKMEKLTPALMVLLLKCSVTENKTPTLDVRQKKKPAA